MKGIPGKNRKKRIPGLSFANWKAFFVAEDAKSSDPGIRASEFFANSATVHNYIATFGLLWISSLGVFSDKSRAEELFPVALTSDLSIEELEDDVQVWLPKNYDPARKWPVIFYYHGTNGGPTIEFLRVITGSEDWVLVGMGYKKAGRFEYTEENLSGEIKVFQSVLEQVEKRAGIDPRKIYVAGMSKGGWMTGLFLQKLPTLAGGMILGGGLIDATGGEFDPADHVFIGAGELDGNVAMSYGARDRFTKGGATVTLDIWEGLGHQLPDAFYKASNTAKLKQWLRVEAGNATQAEAIAWFEKENGDIEKEEASDKVAAFHRLIRLSDMPFRKLLDKEAEDLIRKKQEAYREDPALKSEMAAWVGFQKAIIHESKDRTISTLAEALAKYSGIAKTYPDTRFGKKASASVTRIKTMLGME